MQSSQKPLDQFCSFFNVLILMNLEDSSRKLSRIDFVTAEKMSVEDSLRIAALGPVADAC